MLDYRVGSKNSHENYPQNPENQRGDSGLRGYTRIDSPNLPDNHYFQGANRHSGSVAAQIRNHAQDTHFDL
jgi:hypothetical protein